MKVHVGAIVKAKIYDVVTFFLVATFTSDPATAMLFRLPSTKYPDDYDYDSIGCSNFSKETDCLKIESEGLKDFVHLPESLKVDDDKFKLEFSSRKEYGERLYHGLYYSNETLENPERRLDV